jgi:hypothetical protein
VPSCPCSSPRTALRLARSYLSPASCPWLFVSGSQCLVSSTWRSDVPVRTQCLWYGSESARRGRRRRPLGPTIPASPRDRLPPPDDLHLLHLPLPPFRPLCPSPCSPSRSLVAGPSLSRSKTAVRSSLRTSCGLSGAEERLPGKPPMGEPPERSRLTVFSPPPRLASRLDQSLRPSLRSRSGPSLSLAGESSCFWGR